MRYRKKPVEVEAVTAASLIDAFEKDWSALPGWAAQAYEDGVIVAITRDEFTIKTLEGDHRATRADDMVIRGVAGEIYPCKVSIFWATYEAVTDA